MFKRHLKFAIVLIFLFLNLGLSIGQKNITINTSPSVDRYMQQFIYNGKSNENIKAWRIQIITTDNRRDMEQAIALFKNMYPEISMDWQHLAPYYQVRVGHFETRNKLMPFLLDFKKTFPAATPVYDTVSKRSLVNN